MSFVAECFVGELFLIVVYGYKELFVLSQLKAFLYLASNFSFGVIRPNGLHFIWWHYVLIYVPMDSKPYKYLTFIFYLCLLSFSLPFDFHICPVSV